jgi:hypothetical protein
MQIVHAGIPILLAVRARRWTLEQRVDSEALVMVNAELALVPLFSLLGA